MTTKSQLNTTIPNPNFGIPRWKNRSGRLEISSARGRQTKGSNTRLAGRTHGCQDVNWGIASACCKNSRRAAYRSLRADKADRLIQTKLDRSCGMCLHIFSNFSQDNKQGSLFPASKYNLVTWFLRSSCSRKVSFAFRLNFNTSIATQNQSLVWSNTVYPLY